MFNLDFDSYLEVSSFYANNSRVDVNAMDGRKGEVTLKTFEGNVNKCF